MNGRSGEFLPDRLLAPMSGLRFGSFSQGPGSLFHPPVELAPEGAIVARLLLASDEKLCCRTVSMFQVQGPGAVAGNPPPYDCSRNDGRSAHGHFCR